jgi:nicotinate-nucleotide--dimethylbenzimidazole phosphoribosyltransferase
MSAFADGATWITPTFNPALEQALVDKLSRVGACSGAFGVLEAVAILLGLIQNSLTPSLPAATLALIVADHGFATGAPNAVSATAQALAALREDRLPLAPLARVHEAALRVVYASGAETAPSSEPLAVQRVRVTADARLGPAMRSEEAHAAVRLGMREGDRFAGAATVCAGVGAGADLGAALVLGALTQRDPAEFASGDDGAHALLESIRARHAALWTSGAARDPVEVLAAVGGLEVAVLAGVVLGAAARRRVVLVDGMAAVAAFQVASRVAPYVADYCIPVRSHSRRSLAAALELCRPALPSGLDFDAMDGTAGVLALSMLRSATALLATRVA